MQIAWGSVPDWLAGGGAVIALLWARKAARATLETSCQQAVQIEAMKTDRRRAQADKVAAWIDPGKRDGDPNGNHPAILQFIVRNVSDLPVYYVHVWATTAMGEVVSLDILNAVPPGVSELAPPFATPGTLKRGQAGRQLWTSMMFADAAGRFWYRERDGKLTSIDFEEAQNKNKELRALRQTEPAIKN